MNPNYFAFGSNLSEDQMRQRCPSAVLLGRASWGGSVASIVASPGERVPGLLYRVSPDDLLRLDRFEGAPFVYARHQRRVLDGGRAERRAHVYELAVGARCGEPSLDYVLTILRAYRRHGLALDALSSALAFSREASQ